jgi:cellulose synthase/poly-beta-1,6-N-acetylglucosamine synthase-like glycosyltransferase
MFENLWLVWLVYTPFAVNFLRHYLRNHSRYEAHPTGIIHSPFITFQVTTKGGTDVVQSTVHAVHGSCYSIGFSGYAVNVVTDNPDDRYEGAMMVYVPESYQPKHARYKGRALQYAMLRRASRGLAHDKDWVMLLDEESKVTTQTVKSILQFIDQEKGLIGEGPILYPHKWNKSHPVLIINECLRSYYCHECVSLMEGYPLYMHGSNLLVRADVEAKVGWDFESIAEDQAFGFRAHELYGDVFGWHGGVLEEQPPLSFGDAYRARRRWFTGIMSNVKAIKDRWLRLKVLARLASWGIGFIGGLTTFIGLFLLQSIPDYARPLLIFLTVVWQFGYHQGLHLHLQHKGVSTGRQVLWHLAAVPLAWICGIVETVPAFVSLIKPSKGWTPTRK